MVYLTIREIEQGDLDGLLELYAQLHDGDALPDQNRAHEISGEIMKDRNHHIIVGLVNDRIVSSCVLAVILNLTRGGRPYALIENVVTDRNHRGNGYATALLRYALQIAQRENCYKMMLMTSSKHEDTLRFYRRAGFNSSDKTAFIQWLGDHK